MNTDDENQQSNSGEPTTPVLVTETPETQPTQPETTVDQVETPALEYSDEQQPVYPTADDVVQSTNTTQTSAVFKTTEVNQLIKDDSESLSVLQVTREQAADIIEKNPKADGSDKDSVRWGQILSAAFESLPMGKRFEATAAREGADFKQGIDTEKGLIGLSVPRFAENGPKLRGEQAALRVRALLGMGSITSIPLVHSGFWITIKTPSDSTLIELRRRLMEEKITLGRDTHGLVFSNVQSYSNGWLLDLVLDHMYSCTLKDTTNIRQMIKTPDLPILFWGLAASIWPNGFNYVRADMSEEGIANKRFHSGLIDIKKLLWVDNTSLTPKQKAHMSNRVEGSVTTDSVNIYLEEFVLTQGRSVQIGTEDNPILVNLAIPSVDEFIKSGYRWITGLADIIERTFTGPREDYDGRNNAIVEHANATIMRQYAHWIKSITVDGVEQSEQDFLDDAINSFAENKEVRSKLFDEIGKFIDDCTVAVVGIPESNGQALGPKRFPRIIPIDTVSTFFILLMQRAKKILTQ